MLLCAAYNVYFLFLVKEAPAGYLLYLDFLIVVFGLLAAAADFIGFRKRARLKKEFLELESVVYQEFAEWENVEIAAHDVRILQKKLEQQRTELRELQDYIAKWCHEVKIPLAASLLMVEHVGDAKQRQDLREQMERISCQLNAALLGCRAQSSILDLQIKRVSLAACVTAAIHNHQYFLIRQKFTLDVQVRDVGVYTDQTWLVYVLDQLISNAVKYAKEEPLLKIWSEKKDDTIRLYVEDHGEGIRSQDIRRVFERGYTGSNHHNGRYRSTGIGLYLVSVICEKLGHGVSVESEFGCYTRFTLVFQDQREFFCR